MADPAVAIALTQHDRTRRSTDIPLFYGRKDKDTISPQQLVDRLAKARGMANGTKRDSVTSSICA